MPIEFRCNQCHRLLRVAEETAGKQARCPECEALTQIPDRASASAFGASPTPPLGPESPWPGSTAEAPTGSSAPAASPFAPGAETGSPFNSDNPYQSPTAYSSGSPSPAGFPYELRAYAESRVSGPATGLMVVGAVGVLFGSLLLVVNLIGIGMGGAAQAPDPEGIFFSGVVGGGFQLLSIAIGAVIIAGAQKMKRLESHGFAMASAILAMVPCTSPCCWLGLPFGIWALVALSDPHVKAAFGQ